MSQGHLVEVAIPKRREASHSLSVGALTLDQEEEEVLSATE